MAKLARSANRQKLEIRGVNVTFQGLVAVQNVSETLLSGEILGLIGPNGAGKTTLVNAVTGFQALSGGDVLLEEVSIARLPPQRIRRRGIARTFQAGRLFHTMTVLENVELAALSAGQTRRAASEQAHNILAWIGLSAVAAVPTEALPYSDERRVGIARALAGEPAFVLLDEPAAGMSDLECDRLIEIIRDIPRKFGSGVLLIEHNVRLVMTVCERIHVLDSGRTIASGAPEIVRYDPAVVKAYIGEGRNHAA
jgi:branched-chain amino acid transport system ATP-binding protein